MSPIGYWLTFIVTSFISKNPQRIFENPQRISENSALFFFAKLSFGVNGPHINYFFLQIVCFIGNNLYFCTVSSRSLQWRGGLTDMIKGRLRTLSSVLESRKFDSHQEDFATERLRWEYYMLVFLSLHEVHIIIYNISLAWAARCLSLVKAMREPKYVVSK